MTDSKVEVVRHSNYLDGRQWLTRHLAQSVPEDRRKGDHIILCQICDIGTSVSDLIHETLSQHEPALEHVLAGVVVDNSLWRTLGYYHSGRKDITLSARWMVLGSKSETRNTIKHEIAHAIVDYRHGTGIDHGREWKEVCDELGIPAFSNARMGWYRERTQFYNDAVRRIRVQYVRNCGRCTPLVRCPACSGSGLRRSYDRAGNWQTIDCGRCRAKGIVVHEALKGSIHMLDPLAALSSEVTLTKIDYQTLQEAHADLHQQSVRILRDLGSVVRLPNCDFIRLVALFREHESVVTKLKNLELTMWAGRGVDFGEKRERFIRRNLAHQMAIVISGYLDRIELGERLALLQEEVDFV